MTTLKSSFIKFIISLIVLAYCFYTSPNQITFDIIAVSIVSCRYLAISCVEWLYARLDRANYAV